jgi:SAM-dependent methyltransferase
MKRLDVYKIIEGFYVGHIVYYFHQQKLFERLTAACHPWNLAEELDYDKELFSALIEFLFQATDLLSRNRKGEYLLQPRYRRYYALGFQLDKFIGTYGPPVAHLHESLQSLTLGRPLVDRQVQAQAYERLDAPVLPLMKELLQDMGVHSLLDLGCGPAHLLRELAAADATFQGWGIDASPSMCKAAVDILAHTGFSHRVRILHGDARAVGQLLTVQERVSIDALHCKGLFNELFRNGNAAAVECLVNFRMLFPGRPILIVEYYGKLTQLPVIPEYYLHTVLHDVAQVVSAQGIPPPDRHGWADVYYAAGCRFEHAYEGEANGIQWFIHRVRLGEE